jgi:hypothetical protein
LPSIDRRLEIPRNLTRAVGSEAVRRQANDDAHLFNGHVQRRHHNVGDAGRRPIEARAARPRRLLGHTDGHFTSMRQRTVPAAMVAEEM